MQSFPGVMAVATKGEEQKNNVVKTMPFRALKIMFHMIVIWFVSYAQ